MALLSRAFPATRLSAVATRAPAAFKCFGKKCMGPSCFCPHSNWGTTDEDPFVPQPDFLSACLSTALFFSPSIHCCFRFSINCFLFLDLVSCLSPLLSISPDLESFLLASRSVSSRQSGVCLRCPLSIIYYPLSLCPLSFSASC